MATADSRTPARPWQISVDTGGTFTDAFGIAPDGARSQVKVLSSGKLRAAVVGADGKSVTIDRDFGAPENLFSGFQLSTAHPSGSPPYTVTAWDPAPRELLLDREFRATAGAAVDLSTGEEVPVIAARLLTGTPPGRPFPDIAVRLATTRATNALLEGKGTPPLLLLPEGLGDLLEIGDQRRPALFALRHEKRRLPLAATVEVPGRLDRDGIEVEPPEPAELAARLRELDLPPATTPAAVALLHSYRNPSHEEAAAAALRAAGFRTISISAQLSDAPRLLPRAETAAADAYLSPVMTRFSEGVRAAIGSGTLSMMTSSGGLSPAAEFRPKDSLLSGPAGGLVGALAAAEAAGIDADLITFDMGGTSTDVARTGGGRLPYRFEGKVGAATVLAPSLRIETVAAGGGSICSLKAEGLSVGPESAGADPGPACYGRGGPLTVTDVNLLLGRIDPDRAGLPLDPDASRRQLDALAGSMRAAGIEVPPDDALLHGLLQIAVERMAEAIRTISVREGYDPAEHVLVAFGGAGPGHACAVAEALGMRQILVPGEAGLLSAAGVAAACPERFASLTVLRPLAAELPRLPDRLRELEAAALRQLGAGGGVARRIAELRIAGQESTLEFEVGAPGDLPQQFATRFRELFGYPPPARKEVELVALRVSARAPRDAPAALRFGPPEPPPSRHRVEAAPFATLVIAPGWSACRSEDGSIWLEQVADAAGSASLPEGRERAASPLALDLARGRLGAIVDDMGALLKRCALSTNIREREDYSCAVLDADGRLAINAPHIPVHLGALGLCVRRVAGELPLGPGDIAITNHPGFGGSHLPDITVVAAAFDRDGRRVAYLANRAHHAEIGGIAPGSMPPSARSLAQEGAVIRPAYLYRNGVAAFETISALLSTGSHPTRNLDDNLADLGAQAAALRGAVRAVEAIDGDLVRASLARLLARSAELTARRIGALPFTARHAVESLDSGAQLHVTLRRDRRSLSVDFTGTSPTLGDNLNATPAIVRSTVLYVLRLLLDDDLPLNEGLLHPVEITLPECLLNPSFGDDPESCPPVVGGNVETSQRLADVLIKALELQAGSQGTMNNFLFGDATFGYYETVCGGAGAGPGYAGASALHTHMTNTAITDPEVLEWRYPVRLRRFSVRRGSGGEGRYRGGDGVVREFELLAPLTVSILAEHRRERPFGLAGGAPGATGEQSWTAPDGTVHPLPARFSGELPKGAKVRLETPGGGGYGPG